MRVTVARRLGLSELVTDHFRTLYETDSEDKQSVSVADVVVFYAMPFGCGVAAAVFGVRLNDISTIIAGISIFTALLFGLLIHVFVMGMEIASNPKWTKVSRVTILVGELRANVAYSCGVGLLLTTLLIVASSISETVTTVSGNVEVTATPVTVWLSALIIGLLVHLLLTLLMVLKRIRSAYRLMSK